MKELSCEQCRELLPWYVAGALSPEEDARVRAHLAQCSECHRLASQWRGIAVATQTAYDAIPVPTPEETTRLIALTRRNLPPLNLHKQGVLVMTSPAGEPIVDIAPAPQPEPPKRSRFFPIAALGLGVLIILLASFGFYYFRGNPGLPGASSGSQNVIVPNFIGMDYDQAKIEAANDHLTLTPVYQTIDTSQNSGTPAPANNSITAQNPAQGIRVPWHTNVTVTVAALSQTVVVPPIFNKTVQQACDILTAAKLTCQTDPTTFEQSDAYALPKNTVVGTDPAQGTSVPQGASIRLVVSSGQIRPATPTTTP